MSDPSGQSAALATHGGPARWYRVRWRLLLPLLLLLTLLGGRTLYRQHQQQRAKAQLDAWNVPYRTQPIAPPAAWWLPPALADEIVEVYWRDPDLDERRLALLVPLSTIEKLELSTAPLTPSGLRMIARLRRLDTLHLDGTTVTDEGLIELVGLQGLRVLSLDDTKVTDEGLRWLARLRQLERLSLNGTRVSDAGLGHLVSLSNLKELSLVGTQITDASLVHLARLRRLELLKLHHTQVTLEGMQRLHAALPQCVIWLPSE